MKIRSVSTYKELLELKESWIRLFEISSSNNIFLSWEWFNIWYKYYGAGRDFLILVVEDGNEIISIAPFMINKGNLLSCWKPSVTFFSDDLMADYMDFLILKNHEESTRLIINYLLDIKKWSHVVLKRIPEWSESVRQITEIFQKLKYKHIVRIICRSPYIRINGSLEDYFNTVSSKLKQDIRTTQNKIKKIGDLAFERLNCENLKEHFIELFAIHEGRQSEKSGKSIFSSQKNRDFLSEIALEFIKLDLAEITVLKINAQIVSFVYALKYGKIYYYWIPAINADYQKLSLGKLHLKFLLQECFNKNFQVFDFMIGSEDYKIQWAKKIFNNYEIIIYNNKILYLLDCLKFAVYKLIKEILHRYLFLQKLRVLISKINFST